MNYAYYDNFWIYDCSRLRLDMWTSTLSQIIKLQITQSLCHEHEWHLK